MSNNLALDQEFESGVRLIRDAYSRKLSQKEAEVVQLRGENARKDAEIRELKTRIGQLEVQLNRAEKRAMDMTRAISKLNSFKQSVLDSFEEDELSRTGAGASDVDQRKSYLPSGAIGNSNKMNLRDIVGGDSDAIQNHVPPPHSATSAVKGAVGVHFERTDGGVGGINTGLAGLGLGVHSSQPPPPRTNHDRYNSNVTSTSSYPTNHIPGLKRERYDNDLDIPSPLKTAAGNNNTQPPSGYQSFSHTPAPQATVDASAQYQTSADARGNNETGTNSTIDGRNYFRKAKSILSYDEFTMLLHNVKAYNNREQSKAKTLQNVRESLGSTREEMYVEFERLLLSN